MVAPKDSVGSALSKAAQPDPSTGGIASMPGEPTGGLTGPPAPINDLGGAMLKVGGGLLARIAGALAPYLAAGVAPAAANGIVFAIVVDAGSAASSELFDDLQKYLQTHSVNLGPFNFVKSDF